MVEVRLRDVPQQHVVSEMGTVDQAGLEAWLPGAMARVAQRARAAGGLLGSADWPFLERSGCPDEPVFVTIYRAIPMRGRPRSRSARRSRLAATGRFRPTARRMPG